MVNLVVDPPRPTRSPEATRAKPPGPREMQEGERVPDGWRTPALMLPLTSAQIATLLASGRAVAFARARDKDLAFFDVARQFRPIQELDPARVSNRLVFTTDPTLEGSWRFYANGVGITERVVFALRFSPAFERALIERQYQAVKMRGIDLDAALAQGRIVTTEGVLDAALQFVVTQVSER